MATLTELERAAIAWRDAELEWQKCSRDPRGMGVGESMVALGRAEEVLRVIVDDLIAAQGHV